MQTAYSTIILRYVHDVVTGEFVNIGVVLYSPEQRFLGALFTESFHRLDAMFLQIDHPHLSATLEHITERLGQIGDDIQNASEVPALTALGTIVRQVLPADDSSLQWSQPSGGFTDDPSSTLVGLFNRVVGKYSPPGTPDANI